MLSFKKLLIDYSSLPQYILAGLYKVQAKVPLSSIRVSVDGEESHSMIQGDGTLEALKGQSVHIFLSS